MLDFVRISTRSKKQGVVEIYPNFVMKKSSDLMIRGGDFYAVWVEENGLWSTDEQDVIDMIDRELKNFTIKYKENSGNESVHTLYMWDATSGMIDDWHKYCQKQLRDNYHPLDEELIFSNMETKKTDYASKKLPYPLEQGNISAYNKLISTLYSEEERRKIEWAIGSIVAGDSKYIQKFMVLYGAAGTGKSTILNIIQALFEGYYSVFDAKALGSSNNSFALEAFKTNPLVAIQHDGDLSRIEDNTRLNSLVSHELMTVNEKFKSAYSNRFNAFLFMGTNKPVKITDGKSGLIRRLIDVSPSGNKLNPREYKEAMDQVAFELGGIAYHCKKVYLENPGAFDNYTPIAMLGASNDFYNFVVDSFRVFKKDDRTTLKAAWEMYKVYCEDARVPYPFSQRTFKEELKNYFREFTETFNDGAGSRNVYSGFRSDIFEKKVKEVRDDDKSRRASWIKLEKSEVGKIGPFEDLCSDAPAQYANSDETPRKGWTKVKTKLKDLDVSKLHYVKVPEWLIVIDFDLKDEDGNKSLEKNLEAASKWPATYAEVSKGGAGLHLHYIYKGDVSKLSRIYDKDIEIKVFTGNSSLRRKLTLCNSLLIATISSGLPMKEEKMISTDIIQSEKGLRTTIKKCLAKEVHPQGTKPNVDFIYKVLEDAYNSGMSYDVSDMKNAVYAFAAQSSNQSDLCIKLVSKMKFKSEEAAPNTTGDVEKPIIFFDCEVFPNLFLVNWKFQGKDKPIVRLINPRPTDIAELRSRGTTGWYSEDYGGGWYMTDADWIRAYNGKGITTNGNMFIGGYIQSNNIINTTYEYQSNRGSVDWRFGAATGTADENFFSFYDTNNGIIPLAIDGNFGNIYVGFNVGGSGSKTAVGIYLGAQVAGNRAFIYHGDSYAGSIWIQTRLDGSWKWFSLGRVCSTALSDIRLKGNIRDTEVENATKVIESMKIRSFERKDSHKKYKIGFIADELEQLDPNLVDGGGEVDGHPYYKSVNNLQMLAYVVKSMQELNQRVSELEKENEKLKRKLNLK